MAIRFAQNGYNPVTGERDSSIPLLVDLNAGPNFGLYITEISQTTFVEANQPLDIAYFAQPFVQGSLTPGVNINNMDYAYWAQPYVIFNGV